LGFRGRLSRHTTALAGYTDYGHVGDRRVLPHDAFDVGRIDILAARQDHVLLAIDDIEEALCVKPAEVPGVQPLAAHSTRMEAAHDLAVSGIDLTSIMHSGGWNDLSMANC
jgi:hypothetical protein